MDGPLYCVSAYGKKQLCDSSNAMKFVDLIMFINIIININLPGICNEVMHAINVLPSGVTDRRNGCHDGSC